jgi:hypothetical protein
MGLKFSGETVAKVICNGKAHTVCITKTGRLRLRDHTKDEVVAMRAAGALGLAKPRCLVILDEWRNAIITGSYDRCAPALKAELYRCQVAHASRGRWRRSAWRDDDLAYNVALCHRRGWGSTTPSYWANRLLGPPSGTVPSYEDKNVAARLNERVAMRAAAAQRSLAYRLWTLAYPGRPLEYVKPTPKRSNTMFRAPNGKIPIARMRLASDWWREVYIGGLAFATDADGRAAFVLDVLPKHRIECGRVVHAVWWDGSTNESMRVRLGHLCDGTIRWLRGPKQAADVLGCGKKEISWSDTPSSAEAASTSSS